MANELVITSRAKLDKGHLKKDTQTRTIQVTQSGTGCTEPVFSIGTSEEAVTFTDIGTMGWLWMQNIDATNYVEWGPESGGAMVAIGKMKAGETAGPFRLKPGITLRLQANTAACKVQFMLTED